MLFNKANCFDIDELHRHLNAKDKRKDSMLFNMNYEYMHIVVHDIAPTPSLHGQLVFVEVNEIH